MRALTLALVGAAATALSLGALLAQPAGDGGPASRPASRPSGPGGGFHLIPVFAAEKMNLTDDQRKQLDELAKETKAKLDKILTPEQQKILEEARPPRPGQGAGGPGGGQGGRGPGGQGGGPGGGGAGGRGGRPPSE